MGCYVISVLLKNKMSVVTEKEEAEEVASSSAPDAAFHCLACKCRALVRALILVAL